MNITLNRNFIFFQTHGIKDIYFLTKLNFFALESAAIHHIQSCTIQFSTSLHMNSKC